MPKRRSTDPGDNCWHEVWDGPHSLPIARAAEQIETFDDAIELLEGLLPVFDQATKLVGLPRAEFDRQFPAVEREFRKKATNPAARGFLPVLGSIVEREQGHLAQLALFRAAVTVVEHGPEKLREIKDPFGSGPFEYRMLDKGFELKSQFHYLGKPMVLRVGEGKVE